MRIGAGTETNFDLGGSDLPRKFFFKILVYIQVLILAILFYKITLFLPLIISLTFLRVMLLPQFFLQYFLQTIEVENSYWFVFGPPLTPLFDLPITIRYISNWRKCTFSPYILHFFHIGPYILSLPL